MKKEILVEAGQGANPSNGENLTPAFNVKDQKGLAFVGEISPTPQYSHLVNGLPVFLDGDGELNRIRLTAKDPVVVIMAVAVRRAQQIARNYASKHAPHLVGKVSQATIEFTYRFNDKQIHQEK